MNFRICNQHLVKCCKVPDLVHLQWQMQLVLQSHTNVATLWRVGLMNLSHPAENSAFPHFFSSWMHLKTPCARFPQALRCYPWPAENKRLKVNGSHTGSEFLLFQQMEQISRSAFLLSSSDCWYSKVRRMWSSAVIKRIIKRNLWIDVSKPADCLQEKSLARDEHFG